MDSTSMVPTIPESWGRRHCFQIFVETTDDIQVMARAVEKDMLGFIKDNFNKNAEVHIMTHLKSEGENFHKFEMLVIANGNKETYLLTGCMGVKGDISGIWISDYHLLKIC